MEVRERILQTAARMMSEVGITSVTMDLIARECGISKRTLYEQIADKRTLVWESFAYKWEQERKISETILAGATDIQEGLLKIYLRRRAEFKKSSKVFIYDLRRLYPELDKRYREMHREAMKDFVDFLERGVQAGLYRDDIDLTVATMLFYIETNRIKDDVAFFPEETNLVEICDTAFITFVRGISTLRGIEIMDRFIADNHLQIKAEKTKRTE